MIRNEWGKIVRDMGMSIRPSFRETVVEPAGDSCLCIVFNDPMNFAIGSRPSVLGAWNGMWNRNTENPCILNPVSGRAGNGWIHATSAMMS